MGKLTINRVDNRVGFDGLFFDIDLSSLNPNLRVVQWDADTQRGHAEWESGGNTPVYALPSEYYSVYLQWEALKNEAVAKAADRHHGLTAPQKIAAVLAERKAEVDALKQEKQFLNFTYNGHQYYADADATETIDKTLAVCLSRGLADNDPVPTPPPVAGCWVAADINPETGQRYIIPTTYAMLKGMSDALYNRNAILWGVALTHKGTLEAMAAGGATAAALMAYNITANW